MLNSGGQAAAGNRAMRRAAQRTAPRAARTRRGVGARAATTALLAISTVPFVPAPASAASFAVTNLDDTGAGSLRDAIAAANGSAGADVITFAPGLTGTITLGSGQLTITDSLEIVGPGRAALAVNANGAGRVIDIPSSPGDVLVSISGLTASGGYEQTGGGIRVQDEGLSLDDVALVGNTAVGNGGGLYADGFAMTLNVRNSTISGNVASGGGGAYIEDTGGATTFENVVIDGNTASQEGGGIFFYDPDADVILANATITNNVAAKGGGIYLYSQDGGSFTVSNSTISGNEATVGGGVYLYDIDRPVLISESTISANAATNGGGINIDRISAPATISNSTISGNTATGAGGGVRLARGGGLTMANSTITENSASDAGGARFPGPVALSHVIVAGNTATTTADLLAAGGVTADFSVIGTMVGAVTDGGGNQLGITDPMLAPLADNGGPTFTHLLLGASPALEAGNPAVAAPPNDQRGAPRISGTIDIGAVEVQRGTIQLDGSTVTLAESEGTLTVTVTRSGPAELPATVEIATTDGTAIAPGDYGAVATQLSWAAGETGTKSIDIPLVLDAEHETDETFTVALGAVSGDTLGPNTVVAVTLEDSNTAPRIAEIADVTAQLGAPLDPINALVGDAEQPASALTVTAASSNPAVVADGDISVSGLGPDRTLSIAPRALGTTTITVTVTDGVLSTVESFIVTVVAAPPTTTEPEATTTTTTTTAPTASTSTTVPATTVPETTVATTTTMPTTPPPAAPPARPVVTRPTYTG